MFSVPNHTARRWQSWDGTHTVWLPPTLLPPHPPRWQIWLAGGSRRSVGGGRIIPFSQAKTLSESGPSYAHLPVFPEASQQLLGSLQLPSWGLPSCLKK